MTAKEYLQQLRNIDGLINSKIETVEKLRALLLSVRSVDTTTDKVQVHYQSKIEETIIKIADLEQTIKQDIDKLVELKQTAIKLIDSVDNTDYRLILASRYINMMAWEEIAVAMNYTYQWTHTLHGRALVEFGKVYKNSL